MNTSLSIDVVGYERTITERLDAEDSMREHNAEAIGKAMYAHLFNKTPRSPETSGRSGQTARGWWEPKVFHNAGKSPGRTRIRIWNKERGAVFIEGGVSSQAPKGVRSQAIRIGFAMYHQAIRENREVFDAENYDHL